MPASSNFENNILQHILQNASIALIGDATGLRGSATAGVLYVSLHTADPSGGNVQTTSEATYTGYTRISVTRDSSGWTVSGNIGENAALIAFGACTAGSNTIAYFGIGTAASGAGNLLLSGPVSPNLAVSAGITPQFAINALTITVT